MSFRLLIVFLALAGVGPVCHAADKPNVIVIYTDDQGYGDASCLNPDAKFETPNLDRLAKEGMTFTDAHCSDTVCTPSRYGLLTGRYSWRTWLKGSVFGSEVKCLIVDERMTIASLLKANGYHTAMVGKWHLGMDFPGDRSNRDWTQPIVDMPLDKGFDYFFGIPASLNFGVLAWFEGRHAKVPPTQYTQKKKNKIAISDYRIMPPYETELTKPGKTTRLGITTGQKEVAPDFIDSECLTRFTNKAIEWIEGKAEEAREGKPFFLYLPYTSPHKPVIPIDQFRGKSEAGAYGDFMMETDWHIGRILELLDREQIADNTLIIFSSDNGPETTWKKRIELHGHHSNGIYRDGKRSIYEGGHRVPFFVRWPAKIKAGMNWGQPICQTDLLSTFAEMLDQPLPDSAGEDSVSFYPVLLGQSPSSNRAPIIHHSIGGDFAIRDGQWKLVMETGKKERELYNIESDPSEKKDVIDQHPDIANQLVEKINKIILDGRSTEGKPQPNDTGWWKNLRWMEKW